MLAGLSGTYTLSLTVADASGNQGAASTTFTVISGGAAARYILQGYLDRGELDRQLRRPGLRRDRRLVEPAELRHGHPLGRQQLRLGAVDDRHPRPADLGRLEPDRGDLVDDDELRGRREPHRRSGARPGAVLPRLGSAGAHRAGADQRRGHRCGAEHADDLGVPVGGVPGLRGQREHRDHDHQAGGDQQRPQRPVPRPGVVDSPRRRS